MSGARATIMVRVSAAVLGICMAAAWMLAATPQAGISARDALWIIVHDECVPDELHSHDPKPCTQVDLDSGIDKGFAVLKDIRGGEQYLLIPTARIPGIESPTILAPDAPNYFADAWEARTYIDQALHKTLPREDVGLAINSAVGRSQDQLHIHVDCVRADVQETLRDKAGSIRERWAPIEMGINGHHYWARWVAGEQLGENNPFRLLAAGLPDAAKDMGDRTLVVIGSSRANGAAGFVILEDQVDRDHGDAGTGEELLDHACALATSAASPPKN